MDIGVAHHIQRHIDVRPVIFKLDVLNDGLSVTDSCLAGYRAAVESALFIE